MRDGEPCSHKGCLSHISHPCEGCGRIGGVLKWTKMNMYIVQNVNILDVMMKIFLIVHLKINAISGTVKIVNVIQIDQCMKVGNENSFLLG